MYVAHAAYFVGVFLCRGELCLLVYAALYAVAIHMWIVWGEEPELRERFGTEYDRYAQTVPRWLWTRPR
jgi:protein-S-isoprenylcysteine O-methyltransferase Ste14